MLGESKLRKIRINGTRIIINPIIYATDVKKKKRRKAGRKEIKEWAKGTREII